MFRQLTQEERIKIAECLRNEGRFRIVTDGGKIWVIKHNHHQDSEKRDLLGYLLGKDFLNVAEVKLVTNPEVESLKLLLGSSEIRKDDTFLVRLAHSYTLQEIPCRTVEEATAAELVYSVWIRRRDPHIDNRVYIEGVPIFFDFHIAFLGEPELADATNFFSQTSDYGRAGLWRVKKWGPFLQEFTGAIHPNTIGAFHFVHDLDSFSQYIEKGKDTIRTKIAPKAEALVHSVNFSPEVTTQIIEFLKRNLGTLDTDVNRMIEVVKS